MKTAITIIAICEVIRTIQITIDLAISAMVRKKTLESINKVENNITDEFTAEKLVDEFIRMEAENERGES